MGHETYTFTKKTSLGLRKSMYKFRSYGLLSGIDIFLQLQIFFICKLVLSSNVYTYLVQRHTSSMTIAFSFSKNRTQEIVCVALQICKYWIKIEQVTVAHNFWLMILLVLQTLTSIRTCGVCQIKTYSVTFMAIPTNKLSYA